MLKIMNDTKSLIFSFFFVLILHSILLLPFTGLNSLSHFSLNVQNEVLIKAKIRIITDVVNVRAKAINSKSIKKNKTLEAKPIIDDQKNIKIDKGQNSIFSFYLSHVRQKVLENKSYPFIARKLGQQGAVSIKFTIKRSGEIHSFQLIQRSSYESLNEATIKMVTKIGHFDAFPAGLQRQLIEVVVPVVYELL